MKNKFLILIICAFFAFSSCSKKEDLSYMGSRSCRDCHQRFYDLWESSFHGRAMMDFSRDFADGHLRPCETFIPVGNDAYQYRDGALIERSSRKSFPIRHVLGGKYVYYFLTPLDKGKLQTLPLGYDIKNNEWFDITSSSIRTHQNAIDEALPWRDRRYTFNTACFSCHVSQLSTEYSVQDDSYKTTWLEPGINCETCHGPAEKHNTVYQEAAKSGITPDSVYIKTYTQDRGYSADVVNATCSYCHAKSIPLTPAYVPGDDFFQHFDLVGPEHPDFYPDGRDLGENYTYTSWLMSPCVQNSDMDCLHCHTSSGRFRQKEDPNTACLPCHADRVAHAPDHTRHLPGSPGNLCINCHMPKTSFARMERSDHSMRPPVPATTRAYGSPNACNDCHSTQTTEWAESFILEHFSGAYQTETMMWADYLNQLRQGNAENLNDILPDLIRPLDEVRLSALIRSLQNVRDERIITLAYYFMGHSSPLVRSSAATVLGDYDDVTARTLLYKATEDTVRLVRVRAAAELLAIPKNEIPPDYRGSVSHAIGEYKSSLMAYPDQDVSHYNMGHFHESRSEDRTAARDYRRALSLRPEYTEASINLGMLYYRNGRPDSALYFLQHAVEQNPEHPEANLDLGLLYNELGYREDAADAFLASYHSRRSAVAAYNLAVIFSKQDKKASLQYAAAACELEPDNPKYIYTYAFYLSETGESATAAKLLENALDEHIRSFDIYYLLGTIYKHMQNDPDLQALRKIIAKDKDLTERERGYLKF